jgi:hypothetical protein
MWGLLLCATLAAYLPAIRGSLLWDDNMHVTQAELRSLHGLWRIWFDLGATQQYYPLLHTAFWLEHRLWGDAVLGYHLTNVVLHATSAKSMASFRGAESMPAQGEKLESIVQQHEPGLRADGCHGMFNALAARFRGRKANEGSWTRWKN